ncbi:TetR family transcriptional regulator [Yersinia massiliensis]|uniref:TetR/AcrR family transcriptional regulator n=1 Tax=Yersinia massiliensis TaxID=419257 RepID=UPI0005E0145C|nr:TetR/AcrR family transcriptional regulator [Yersinia massiliensis]CNH51477.1 TetR family transcriptional regulator [Yersinia massiliensis]
MTEDRKTIRKRDAAQSQMRILAAATQEFSQKGFDGARVEQIATQADINKQLIYHYFKNKDELFTRVLEDAYRNIREQEAALQLDHLPANKAILELVDFTWRYYLAHPEFIRLLSSENQQKARHLQQSKSIDDINLSWRGISQTLIERGEREKTIKAGIDAMQLNISISALGFFYLINNATLSIVYQQDLFTPEALEKRLAVMKDTIACWIKP